VVSRHYTKSISNNICSDGFWGFRHTGVTSIPHGVSRGSSHVIGSEFDGVGVRQLLNPVVYPVSFNQLGESN